MFRGEHNQALNYAPLGRRRCYARLLMGRYVD